MTKEATIKLNSINDIYDFNRMVNTVEEDVLIKKNKYIVDAKSMLGIFSVDLSSEVTIIYPKNASAFDQYLQQFIVE